MKKTKEEMRAIRIANARQRIMAKLPCAATNMSPIECNQLAKMEREGLIWCDRPDGFKWKPVDNKKEN